MATQTLYFLEKFNNYFNRRVKKYTDLDDYLNSPERIGFNSEYLLNVSFNPNDGIKTTHVINTDDWQHEWSPDYLLVCEENDSETITSRWFVIEMKRTRLNQYILTLKRDTVADYLDTILDAPCFIEKATLKDSDPFIFNKENMTYNQIKKSETLIKDRTGSAWIIAYVAKDMSTQTITIPGLNDDHIEYEELNTPIESWLYYQYSNLNPTHVEMKKINYIHFSIRFIGFRYASGNRAADINEQGYAIRDGWQDRQLSQLQYTGSYFDNINTIIEPLTIGKMDSSVDNVKSILSTADGYTQSNVDDIIGMTGKIIRDSDGRIFKVNISYGQNISGELNDITSSTGALFISLSNLFKDGGNLKPGWEGTINNETFKYAYGYTPLTVVLEELNQQETTVTIPSTRAKTIDAPYDIIAIPYDDDNKINIYLEDDREYIGIPFNKQDALKVANSLIIQLEQNLYDIQILPYCPITDLNLDDGIRPPTGIRKDYKNEFGLFGMGSEGDIFNYISYTKDGERIIKGAIFYSAISSFTINITLGQLPRVINPADPASWEIEYWFKSNDPIKVQSECDKYRLVSPNYDGAFEFNMAKNGGLKSINVDCTYKPYNPYIHLNPDFGRLYGQNFNDARGLICGGDFSLTIISDPWRTYELNNKNYKAMFNRQIENMEVMNNIQRSQDIVNAITGVGAGAVGGTIIGAKAGSPVAGGVIGGLASAAGGIADIALGEMARKEQLDYTKDLFAYNLGNIQALPYTLNRVSTLNYNNKIFPFIEFWTCTDEEKDALKEKLKYNGMTVMRIGKIKDYLTIEESYIKGQIIRIDDDIAIAEDTHLLNDIFNEINQGVFIHG